MNAVVPFDESSTRDELLELFGPAVGSGHEDVMAECEHGGRTGRQEKIADDLNMLCRPFHLPTLLFACSGALLQE